MELPYNPKIQTYITASERFLLKRNFKDCITYALKAKEIDPNHTSPSQILAIAKVLSSSDDENSNYYSILELPLYTQDLQLIKKQFTDVASLLNPNKNNYPFAFEAFQLVLKIWPVLSNPTKKACYDDGLRNSNPRQETPSDDRSEIPDPTLKPHFDGGLRNPDPTLKTHFDGGLKNPDPNRKTHSAGGLGSSNPTQKPHLDDGLEKSNPTRKTRLDDGLKSEEKGVESGTFWTMCPYCYYVYEFFKAYEDCCMRCQNKKCRRGFHALPIVGPSPPPEVAEKGEYYCFGFSVLGMEGKSLWSPFVKKNDDDEFIEISDDEAAKEEEEDEDGKKEKSLGVEEEFVKVNGGEVTDKECRNVRKKRVKMMANSSNKLFGKGNRVNMNEVFNSERTKNDENFEFGDMIGKTTNENEVEFLVGDDDFYVGLQDDFDVGFGDIETSFFG